MARERADPPASDGVDVSIPDVRISGSTITWAQVSSEITVGVYNGSSTTVLSSNGFACCPEVSGSNVVFVGFDGNDYEIFLYDGTSTIQLSDNSFTDEHPRVSGSYVAWQGFDGTDNEIFFYDGSITTQLTNNNYSEGIAGVLGSRVVWGNGSVGVFVYEAASATTTQIAGPGTCASDVSGAFVAMVGNCGSPGEILIFDGNTTTQLTTSTLNDTSPRISGANVVWNSFTLFGGGSDAEIFHARLIVDELVLNVGDVHTANLLGGSSSVGGVDVTFDGVGSSGTATGDYAPLTPQELSDRVANGDFAPLDFALPGDTAQLWEITYSGAFNGQAHVAFRYDEGGCPRRC